eukprot:COSAG01_NODE_13703_length_1546_cov_2.719419_2_plen_150_part_00
MCLRYLTTSGTFRLPADLGWNDASFHGSVQVPTPHLDALARGGLILDNYYVQPVCSPTRSSILSGRHVIHTGVYGPFSSAYNSGALNVTCNVHPTLECQLLPLKLRQLGYATAMVGKVRYDESRCCGCPAPTSAMTPSVAVAAAAVAWL